MKTKIIADRVLEDAASVKYRLGWSEMTLYRAVAERGFPKPVKLGRYRWFDQARADEWVLAQMNTANG